MSFVYGNNWQQISEQNMEPLLMLSKMIQFIVLYWAMLHANDTK